MRPSLVLAAMLTASALAGCAHAAATPDKRATRDAAYLSVTRGLAGRTDAEQVKTGHATCDYFAGTQGNLPDPERWVTAVKVLLDNGYAAADAGQVIGAATAAYCPQYSALAP